MSFSNSSFVISKGKAYAWGLNNIGQLGLGNTTNKNIPTLISSLENINKLCEILYN